MAKSVLGIDIGYDNVKLALVKGKTIQRTAVVRMPERLLKEGKVVSPETMAELIRTTMKENKMHCQNAALILNDEVAYLREVTMPRMTAEQLVINLPYEFRDYITDELKQYTFDYAMITTPEEWKHAPEKSEEDEDEGYAGGSMELMAAAVETNVLDEYRAMLRKAGLKLQKAAPTVSAYTGIIRHLGAIEKDSEICILDFGYQAIRMHIFRGDRHMVTRITEIGLSSLDDALANHFNVDVHLAHTYLLNNYENCQNGEVLADAFSNIAVELMRVINFYQFSNPDNQLSQIIVCGGGASIPALYRTIGETLDLPVHLATELLPGGTALDEGGLALQAAGIALDSGGVKNGKKQ